MIGNTAFKENVGISMGIDSPPFCANAFPYFLSLNMSNKLFFWNPEEPADILVYLYS